jgi:hypothetical protein
MGARRVSGVGRVEYEMRGLGTIAGCAGLGGEVQCPKEGVDTELRSGQKGKGNSWGRMHWRVWPRYSEVAAHLGLEIQQDGRVDIGPVKGEHALALADDGPWLVRVGVVAYDLGGNHKGGDEETASR